MKPYKTTALQCGDKVLDLRYPQVMGILNVTPDSFADGGSYTTVEQAVKRAEGMVEEGAAIIDIGGESTRPSAAPVSLQEELDRVIPIIEQISKFPVPISIDTYKPEVMIEATKKGASFINDVNALTAPGALETAANLQVPVCLMHKQGNPQTMQSQPQYKNVVSEVKDFLKARISACQTAGISLQQIMADPGFGFGKKLAHNLELLKNLTELTELGVPLLVGLSRKAMLGEILGVPTSDRIYGSVACAVIAAMKGAVIMRVHDVKATMDALKVVREIL